MSFDALIVSSLTFFDWETIAADPSFDFCVQIGCVAMRVGATISVAGALKKVLDADSYSIASCWDLWIRFPDFVSAEKSCVIFTCFEFVSAFWTSSVVFWLSQVGDVAIILWSDPLPVVDVVVSVVFVVIIVVVESFAIVSLDSVCRTATRDCDQGPNLDLFDQRNEVDVPVRRA